MRGCGPRVASILVCPLFLSGLAAAAPPRVVSEEEIVEAMRESQGYSLTATTNGARFQSEVLRRLVKRAEERDPERAPLRVGYAEWFRAYLERTGLAADGAPAFVRLAFDNGQDMDVDYRSGSVLADADAPHPKLAANVRIGWPDKRGGPDRYSYEDVLSTPHLKVTNERVLTYRLLDFGDMVVFGDIDGLRGRPTSGVLGFLFEVLGEGHVRENRMLITPDGLQVSRARAEKSFFSVTQTVTVYPDGRTEKDVPRDRPDLAAAEARLKQPLAVRYRPFPSRP